MNRTPQTAFRGRKLQLVKQTQNHVPMDEKVHHFSVPLRGWQKIQISFMIETVVGTGSKIVSPFQGLRAARAHQGPWRVRGGGWTPT